MRQTRTILSILTLTGAMAGALTILRAQSASLVIQVNPETHLTPSAIPLFFTVVNPGEVVVSQPVTVLAWARALPGQRIQLKAQIASLIGPDGSEPNSAVNWAGTIGRATGGGNAARCTSGNFAGGSVHFLISGWIESGITTCNVSFSLSTAAGWSPGSYAGQVNLQLFAE